MTIYGFVYIWFDRKNKMYCIGSHYHRGRNTSYITSTGWMIKAYRKRPKDFKRRILYNLTVNDRQVLLNEEQRWLNFIDDSELSTSENVINSSNKYYNMKKNAFGGCGSAKKGVKHCVPAHNKGKPMDDAQKLKISATKQAKTEVRALEYLMKRESWRKVSDGYSVATETIKTPNHLSR